MSEILVWLSELLDRWHYEFQGRTVWEWVFLTAPLFVFLEIPRYYLPLIGVVVARWLGYPKVDHDCRRAFLERNPFVSVIVAGRNEGATIEAAIHSLLEQNYDNFEVIIVDDNSEDEMPRICESYARRGLIRFVRNNANRGRGGRPSASNLGLRLARGEFILSLDADTTFDRNLLRKVLGCFADPRVGVVAGNVVVRNSKANLLTRLQTLEYSISIDMRKRWTHLTGCTLQASGALGAFRRAALLDIGGWDQELAEDTDISLRMVKAGWKLVFEPEAVALTEAPTRLRVLCKQRARWDRGGLRTFYVKHHRLMRPSVAGWSLATELWSEFFFAVLATVVYPLYAAWLLTTGLTTFLFVMVFATVANMVLSMFALGCVARFTHRITNPWATLWFAALVTPFYKGVLRWVRFRATVREYLRIDYEDTFLPKSAWFHAPRH